MKSIKERGFSAIETVLIVVIVALIGGLGYWVYHQRQTKKTTASQSVQTAKSSAASDQVDSLLQQDADDESNIDARHESSEQTTAQSADSAASNIGGAYNETNF